MTDMSLARNDLNDEFPVILCSSNVFFQLFKKTWERSLCIFSHFASGWDQRAKGSKDEFPSSGQF